MVKSDIRAIKDGSEKFKLRVRLSHNGSISAGIFEIDHDAPPLLLAMELRNIANQVEAAANKLV